MSEKPPISPEHHSRKETHTESGPKPEKHGEHHDHAQHEKADSGAKIEALGQQAKQEALSGEDIQVEEQAPVQSQTMINKEVKLAALKRTLADIRHKLSKPEKSLSKVIHQPVVDKLSQAAEKTVARPSGVLGAGVAALVGSTAVLYAAKHYGFSYNLSIFFILLFGGYLVGLVLELVMRLMRKH